MQQLLSILDLKDAIAVVNTAWRAGAANHRTALRQTVRGTVAELARRHGHIPSDQELAALEDLRHPPRLSGMSISLAHCPLVGGFVISPAPSPQIGLDLEDDHQVTDAVVRRLGDDEEVRAAPGPGHLWVAKEATFKSLLGPHQPRLLSAIRLSGWQVVAPCVWRFSFGLRGLSGLRGDGCVAKRDHLMMGLARFSP